MKSISKFLYIIIGCLRNPLSKIIESVIIVRPESIIDKINISDVQIMHYKYPSSYSSFFRPNRVFAARYVFVLSKLIFINKNGLALMEDKYILQESYGSLRKLLYWDSPLSNLLKKQTEINDNNLYYYFPLKNFYHFLIEEIPALIYAEKYYPNQLILIDDNKNYPKYFTDFLQIIYGDRLKNKIVRVRNNVLVNKAVFTQRFFESGGILVEDIKKMNGFFSKVLKIEETINKFLYISRKRVKKRALANEGDIEKLLCEYGFKIIYLEELDVIEQINLFANADIIISPHGAGLSHLIWNPNKQKTVLEIFPSNVRNDCFAGISVSLGYNYDYLICSYEESLGQIVDIVNLKLKLKEII